VRTNLYRLFRHDWPIHFVLLLTNWLPDNVLFLRLRGRLVKPFLGSCGVDLRLGRNVCFYNPSFIHLGSNVYIAYGCWFMGGDHITIGDEVLFGPYCVVVSANHTQLNGSFRYGEPERAPITVGNGSWLAAHVTLTAGSRIGNGVLVAAGAVVKDEIPSHVLVGGAPARVIKEYGDA
jgi:acetyltransferase-like isoleucine patch superfamily enzyme